MVLELIGLMRFNQILHCHIFFVADEGLYNYFPVSPVSGGGEVSKFTTNSEIL